MEIMGKVEEDRGKLKNGNGGGGILTRKLFSELDISEFTAKAIREMNHTHLTEVVLALPPSRIFVLSLNIFLRVTYFLCSVLVASPQLLHAFECFCE
jgi:hypothetical protein